MAEVSEEQVKQLAIREAEFKQLPPPLKRLIHQQGEADQDLIDELCEKEPWTIWLLKAEQDNNKTDAANIAKRHKHYKAYSDAGGKIPKLKGYRISAPQPGNKVPTIVLIADEQVAKQAPSAVPIVPAAAFVSKPNLKPVASPSASAHEEEDSLEHQNPQVDVHVDSPDQPVYQAPPEPPAWYNQPPAWWRQQQSAPQPVAATAKSSNNSNWLFLVVAGVALAIIVWALWPYTFGTLGNHASPTPAPVAAAPTPASQQTAQPNTASQPTAQPNSNGNVAAATTAPDNSSNGGDGSANGLPAFWQTNTGTMPDLPTITNQGAWTIQLASSDAGGNPVIAGWLSRLKDPAPSKWKTFPNVPNPDVPGFRVVNGNQVPDGMEYGMAESPFCENNPCDFVVPAQEYRLITADYSFQGMQCHQSDGNGGCLLLIINEGGESYTFRNQVADNGFTVHGRYWNGDALEWGVWGLVSHASANMLNMPTSAHPGESLNFGSGSNGGANCGVPEGCKSVNVTIVVTTGDSIVAEAQTTVTPSSN